MELLDLKIDNKIVHAGVLPRFYARAIDSAALGLFSGACFYVGKLNVTFFLISLLCYAFIIIVYLVYANYKYGATLGKYVAGIRVTNLDGGKISFKQSFLRASVDLFLIVVSWGIFLYSLSEVGLSKYVDSGMWERVTLESNVSPWWYENIGQYFSMAWFVAGTIVFFLNKRRRAIHDYIGKTVVIFEEFSECGHNQTSEIQVAKTGFYLNIKSMIVQVVIWGTVGSMLLWFFFY